MKAHSKSMSLIGSASLIERKLIVWWYRRVTTQRWSPKMNEVRFEYGIRIGSWRISAARSAKYFRDGIEPSVMAGEF